MANHKSAKKRAVQAVKNTLSNKVKLSDARTTVKAVRALINDKKKDQALVLLTQAKSKLAKLASKNVMKKNTASRLTSRLTTQINAL